MIRLGKKEDIKEMSQLIMVILKDMELPFLKEVGEKETLRLLQQAALDDTYRYFYKRAYVKEIDGHVAGVAFGYTDEEEAHIDDAFQRVLEKNEYDPTHLHLFTELETFPNEFYLDTLCVHPNYRKKGIGHELLNALPHLAKEHNRQKIGLAVDENNPKARKLYETLGFKEVGTYVLSGHKYAHMQKEC